MNRVWWTAILCDDDNQWINCYGGARIGSWVMRRIVQP